MSQYSEPGRGRKQCPSCKMYLGVMSKKCECGYEFTPGSSEHKAEPKIKEPKEIKVYTEPGPGRRQCPDCSKYVHIKVGTCVCGHVFKTKVQEHKENMKKQKEAKVVAATSTSPDSDTVERIKLVSYRKDSPEIPTQMGQIVRNRPVLLIPRGKCPVPLSGISEDSIKEWIQALREEEKIYYLDDSVFLYWLTRIYDAHTETFRLAREMTVKMLTRERMEYLSRNIEKEEEVIKENENENENEKEENENEENEDENDEDDDEYEGLIPETGSMSVSPEEMQAFLMGTSEIRSKG